VQLIDCLRLLVQYVQPFEEMKPLFLGKHGASFSSSRYENPEFQIFRAHSGFLEKVEGLDEDVGISTLDLIKAILKHPHYQTCTAAMFRARNGAKSILITGSNDSSHSVPLLSKATMGSYKAYELLSRKHGFEDKATFEATAEGTDLLRGWWSKAEQFQYDDQFVIYTDKRMRVRAAIGPDDRVMCRFTLSDDCDRAILPQYSYDAPRLLQLMKYCKEGASVKITVVINEGRFSFLKVVVTTSQIILTAGVVGSPVLHMSDYHEAVARNDAEVMPYLMTGEDIPALERANDLVHSDRGAPAVITPKQTQIHEDGLARAMRIKKEFDAQREKKPE